MKGLLKQQIDHITGEIIGGAIEVHKAFGPGLLESVYEDCLLVEFSLRGLKFDQQKSIPLSYKGADVGSQFRVDFIVEQMVVVELKSVAKLLPVHEAQLLTYLKLTKLPAGLLINFNVPLLKNGIKRMINTLR